MIDMVHEKCQCRGFLTWRLKTLGPLSVALPVVKPIQRRAGSGLHIARAPLVVGGRLVGKLVEGLGPLAEAHLSEWIRSSLGFSSIVAH